MLVGFKDLNCQATSDKIIQKHFSIQSIFWTGLIPVECGIVFVPCLIGTIIIRLSHYGMFRHCDQTLIWHSQGVLFLQYNVFYSLSSCTNYAVYVKRLKICFHCILSEWDLLYQGFKKEKERRRRPNWNVVVDLDTRQLGRHYIAMFESSQNVMLKPTESWRETLLDSRVMELFFTVSSIVLFCQFSSNQATAPITSFSDCCWIFPSLGCGRKTSGKSCINHTLCFTNTSG